MDVRSVTCFVNVDQSEHDSGTIQRAGQVARLASEALADAGFPVQSTRLATQPLSHLPSDPLPLSASIWAQCVQAGFAYLSMGSILADDPSADLSRLDDIPTLIRSTETVFASVLVARHPKGVHLDAIQRTARIVREIAHTTDRGFGNLRLAMLANVGPHSPFFPAAYHDGGTPALAIATESADLAVAAFSEASTLDQARIRLTTSIEAKASRISEVVRSVAEQHGYRYVGIDFSLAPYPEDLRSIATAVEELGVEAFGAPGTLFAASLLTSCLRQANFTRCGFSGLMLPVLEDARLAARSRENLFSVNDLLLYSSVCGTGLDTVPLPGDVSEQEISGILLDVATLALRLNKPLTARLMPIPGAKAGDLTEFDFAYFANGRVLDVKGLGSQGIFAKEHWLSI